MPLTFFLSSNDRAYRFAVAFLIFYLCNFHSVFLGNLYALLNSKQCSSSALNLLTLSATSEPVVTLFNEELKPQFPTVQKCEKGEYLCQFKPSSPGRYFIIVTVDDVNITGSPFMVLSRAFVLTRKEKL